CLFFFFQAEDGIRDGHVTGVQTCGLPISRVSRRDDAAHNSVQEAMARWIDLMPPPYVVGPERVELKEVSPVPCHSLRWSTRAKRSEERRVGKEWRSRRGRRRVRERGSVLR